MMFSDRKKEKEIPEKDRMDADVTIADTAEKDGTETGPASAEAAGKASKNTDAASVHGAEKPEMGTEAVSTDMPEKGRMDADAVSADAAEKGSTDPGPARISTAEKSRSGSSDLLQVGLKKADKMLIGGLMLLCVALLVPLFNGSMEPDTAVVQVRNEEVLRLDLSRNGQYTVKGTLGDVHIDVKNGAVGVTQENSPHHYCSRQGYVSNTATPIVCLPNDTVITIEKAEDDAQEDTVIQ